MKRQFKTFVVAAAAIAVTTLQAIPAQACGPRGGGGRGGFSVGYGRVGISVSRHPLLPISAPTGLRSATIRAASTGLLSTGPATARIREPTCCCRPPATGDPTESGRPQHSPCLSPRECRASSTAAIGIHDRPFGQCREHQ